MTGLVGICSLALAVLFGVLWVVGVADSAPNLRDLTARNPHPLSRVFAADGTLLGYVHSDTVFSAVATNQIPTSLRHATVAIEDRRFYHHGALDYQGILRAGIKDVFGGNGSLQGASTLTMQLVDNKYLDGTRWAAHHNLKYKIVQAKLAEQLEKGHTKAWILNSYLNDVPYGTVGGQTAIGVGAAAEMFFNKPVWRLNLAQQALLAGLPQAPSLFNPFIHPGFARGRRTAVLQAMVASRYITQDEASAAEAAPLQVHANTSYRMHRQPYVFDYIEQQLNRKLCPTTPSYCPIVANGGLKVYTTIDLRREREAQQAILNHQPGGANLDAQPAAALASIDPTNGHIVALASSAAYNQTKYFYPVQAHRQTGSAFKVFALMTLIHDYDGDPNTTYYNSHFLAPGWLPQAPTWSVHTAELSYLGTINITRATIESDNTVFAQLAADLGWDKLDQTAHAMGITSPLDAYPSEVIGGLRDCCTTLEMADAYATLANGGSHIPPTIISKIVFPDGSSRNFGDPPHKHVFSDGETYAATQVLKGVIQSGTGTAANYGCPAAGKTGTAQDMDNAWFVGYTPQLSTAVWVGYPQANIPMPNGFGGALAAPIWHDYMYEARNGFCGDFPQPTTYWTGVPYVGAHSGPARRSSGSNSGSNGSNPTSQYSNPSLFAAPPQPAPTSPKSTSGGAAPAGGDTHSGGGSGGTTTTGGGHGNGHGGGSGH
jgi:penicillin-binding protein 1A